MRPIRRCHEQPALSRRIQNPSGQSSDRKEAARRGCGSTSWCVDAHSLYAWIKRYSKPQEERQQDDDQHAELRRLRAELKWVTEERDILKRRLEGLRSQTGYRRRPGKYGGKPAVTSPNLLNPPSTAAPISAFF